MDKMEQAEAVCHGTHISERMDEEHNILYQVDSFYTEAYYLREYNELNRFRSFISTDQLEPCTRQIDIVQLLNLKS